MPTYNYICEECKHEWEEDRSIKDPPTKTCPKCKKETAKRLISGGTSFILSGSGWAREGYKQNDLGRVWLRRFSWEQDGGQPANRLAGKTNGRQQQYDQEESTHARIIKHLTSGKIREALEFAGVIDPWRSFSKFSEV